MKTKYKVILALIVAVGIAVSIKSCVDREEPDLTIAYVGHDFVNMTLFEENRGELEEIIGDVDGNGKAVCEMVEISFNENLSTADLSNARQKLANAVGQGSARVYIMEKSFVEDNKDNEVFADLSYLSGDGITNSEGETVGIDVSGSEIPAMLGIENTQELYLAVRKVSEMDHVWDKNIDETDAAARRAAEYILN